MSESLPITSGPRRHQEQQKQQKQIQNHHQNQEQTVFHHPCFPQGFNLPSSESCKNTPNISRKHEHLLPHSLVFKAGGNGKFFGGSHSAHNSPLPHRRLDKLEGVIRDKPSPLFSRRIMTDSDDCSSSVEQSPALPRKSTAANSGSLGGSDNRSDVISSNCIYHYSLQNKGTLIDQNSYSSFPSSAAEASANNISYRRNTECSCILKSPQENCITESPRRRVESDCSCVRRNVLNKGNSKTSHLSECPCKISISSAPTRMVESINKGNNNAAIKHKRKEIIASPAKSIIGEPGVFSSPIHQRNSDFSNSLTTATTIGAAFSSPAKSILGEPGVFASPSRSLCPSPSRSPGGSSGDDSKRAISNEDLAVQPQPDQTVVSGWLKFRDNKRWKIRWGVVTKLSPAADCLHLQLYRDSKDRYKQGQTKASLSLQHFLGVETGFTLDKESNTIAIICQDVIVVLAFDTRERLIQWQVKISNHLGDDVQYLVLVSSAPSKSKMQTGPSRMHIQDHRFCLTTGVPPKLAGLWEIGYLRRYGVVDNRFCFEGGSSCGKGEGLYVFVTDQGEEITQTLKLAAQARLSTKRRQLAKKLTADSPRKVSSPKPMDNDDMFSCHIDESACTCGSRTPYWPSQESRDMDYGCGDTTSVSECHDSFNDGEMFSKSGKANIERCMSCISKLGAPSMSRSSTATGNATPGTGQPPLWTILTEQNQNNLTIKNCVTSGGIDRMSICSSHGSSGGYGSSTGSEYSVPRMTSTTTTNSTYADSCYESIPVPQCCINGGNMPCQNCSQKGHLNLRCSSTKSSLPLPLVNPLHSNHNHHHHHQHHQNCITTQPTQHVGSYENYDVPRNIENITNTGLENYDTPRAIQEFINSEDSCNNKTNTEQLDKYGNYDTPAQLSKSCGCLLTSMLDKTKDNNGPRSDCACNRVMSWADNWISLPYCKRGNGVEHTGVPINKVKLDGEGKMPVMQPSGELAIYATVDFSKKTNRKISEKPCDCSKDDDSETSSSNYINLDPGHILPEPRTQNIQQKTESCSANYTNLDFAQSLENYENSRDLLQRAGITLQEIEELRKRENQNFCHKCGHMTIIKTPEVDKNSEKEEDNHHNIVESNEPQREYLTLDTEKSEPSKFPGYLPMSPAPLNTSASTVTITTSATAPPLPSKSEILKRIIGEKSASNPALSAPTVDRSRKRNDQGRVPGSALMLLHRSGNSPYNRKQIMDNSDLLPLDKRLGNRKRSSSADSSRFIEDAEEFDSSETLRKSSLTQIADGERRSSSPCIHQETETCIEEVCCTKTVETEDETSVTSTSQSQNSQSQSSVHIRRSASVPCKAQNRDSSSSNDSGVSTGSLRHRVGDFQEFELPLTTAMSARRHQKHVQPISSCVHATLPRRSKSFDPLREISFQFQKVEIPGKSTSAEAEVPVCSNKTRGFASPCEGVSTTGQPYVDSRSTSSGTSDMSDYIETLSLSSHSSSDAPENLRLLRQATSTLRPRSGKEYQNIDRSLIALTQTGDSIKLNHNPPSQLRGLLSCSSNYANITPVPENAESPSPGYQSGTSPQELQTESFVFKDELQSNH